MSLFNNKPGDRDRISKIEVPGPVTKSKVTKTISLIDRGQTSVRHFFKTCKNTKNFTNRNLKSKVMWLHRDFSNGNFTQII